VARTIRFTKMSGSGNDFVVVDNRAGILAEPELAAFARAVCPRALAVGADGVLLLEPARKADCDFRLRIFNADGSEPEMCGNGGRCIAAFAAALGLGQPVPPPPPGEGGGVGEPVLRRLRFTTPAGMIGAAITAPGRVRIELTQPSPIVRHACLSFAGRTADVHLVNTGVPHAVVVDEALEALDVRTLGRALRNHPAFAPAGANADFIRPESGQMVRLRTYERGVEDETGACGTGAVAAALVAAALWDWKSPVRVRVRSGEELQVYFAGSGPRFTRTELEGPVAVTFQGVVEF
jgi:diaminopimelate epimerase